MAVSPMASVAAFEKWKRKTCASQHSFNAADMRLRAHRRL